MNEYGKPPFLAYKAFNPDMTCRGMEYKEGETYEFNGLPTLCKRGFHFCKDLVLTLNYYPVNEITENKYAEVEILGDVEFDEPTKHKGCTNKIKIVRVLSDKDVRNLVDGDGNSGYRNSGDGNSGDGNSGDGNSGDGNSGDGNSGYRNSGYRNSGDRNSGDGNSGDGNSGDGNSGYRNSGDGNSGNWNSGYRNSGYRNSGYRNSGDGNSGDGNSGDGNSGYRNSGNWNSGNWNSTDLESGCFNSIKSKTVRIFNKDCDREKWENATKPDFLYFDVDPKIGYKKSFQKSWDNADKIDREKVKDLPNFDADVFYEISGIDLRNK